MSTHDALSVRNANLSSILCRVGDSGAGVKNMHIHPGAERLHEVCRHTITSRVMLALSRPLITGL
jgi:hypothetical protein